MNGKHEINGFILTITSFHYSNAVSCLRGNSFRTHSFIFGCSDDRSPLNASLINDLVFFAFRPTPEEAKKWQTSFESMLKNKFGVQLFQDFLRSQYGEENLNFWLAVEEYKTVEEEGRAERARMIYEDYVSTLSPTEVGDIFHRRTTYLSMLARSKTLWKFQNWLRFPDRSLNGKHCASMRSLISFRIKIYQCKNEKLLPDFKPAKLLRETVS